MAYDLVYGGKGTEGLDELRRIVLEMEQRGNEDGRQNEIVYARILVLQDILRPKTESSDAKFKVECAGMDNIQAIKYIRAKSGVGLREAKLWWERIQ